MTNPLSAEHLIALSGKDVARTLLLRRKRNVRLEPDATSSTSGRHKFDSGRHRFAPDVMELFTRD
jgi:hypothetical protein